jgi:hypothetical protein
MATRPITFEVQAGKAIRVGKVRLIPFSKVLKVQIPGFPGGLVWNRPASMVAVSADGQEQVIPVPDLTRSIQLSILAGGFVGGLMIWFLMRMLNPMKGNLE